MELLALSDGKASFLTSEERLRRMDGAPCPRARWKSRDRQLLAHRAAATRLQRRSATGLHHIGVQSIQIRTIVLWLAAALSWDGRPRFDDCPGSSAGRRPRSARHRRGRRCPRARFRRSGALESSTDIISMGALRSPLCPTESAASRDFTCGASTWRCADS